jgi:heme/copper-type cytochrome/quinol oxidase subunit 1
LIKGASRAIHRRSKYVVPIKTYFGASAMKNFLVLFVNLGVIAFALAALGTFLNYLFGLNIGFKGSALPNDPAIGAVFVVMAGIFGAVAWFVNRRASATRTDQT